MKVQLQPELMKRKPLAQVAEAATPVLEEVIGEAAMRAIATWDFEPDEQGRPMLRLTLADRSVQASTCFTLDELQPPEQARYQLIRLWGDLLDVAMRKQLQKLMAADQDG